MLAFLKHPPEDGAYSVSKFGVSAKRVTSYGTNYVLEQLYSVLSSFRSEWLSGHGVDAKAPQLYQFGDTEEMSYEQFDQWLNEMSGGE